MAVPKASYSSKEPHGECLQLGACFSSFFHNFLKEACVQHCCFRWIDSRPFNKVESGPAPQAFLPRKCCFVQNGMKIQAESEGEAAARPSRRNSSETNALASMMPQSSQVLLLSYLLTAWSCTGRLYPETETPFSSRPR